MAVKAARPLKYTSTWLPPKMGAPSMRRSSSSKPGSERPSGSTAASSSTRPTRRSGGSLRPGNGRRMGRRSRRRLRFRDMDETSMSERTAAGTCGRMRALPRGLPMHRNVARLFILFLLVSGALLAQAPPSTLAAPKDPVATATGFLDLLLRGDYAGAAALEGGPMKEAATAEKLKE